MLLSALNRFQSQFTYRQRFIFFAIVFLLVMPYPTYWMLRSQNYLIHRENRKLEGIEYIKNLRLLLYDAMNLYLLRSSNENDISEKSIENGLLTSIDYHFKELNTMPLIDSEFKSLGEPFSNEVINSLNLKFLEKLWHEIKKSPFNSELSINFINAIVEELKKIDSSFDLNLNFKTLSNLLSINNTTYFPNAQNLAFKLFIIATSTKESSNRLVTFITTKHLFEETANKIDSSLNQAYQLFINTFAETEIEMANKALYDFKKNKDFYLKSLDSFHNHEENLIDLKKNFKKTLMSIQESWEKSEEILLIEFLDRLKRYQFEKNLCIGILMFATTLVFLFVIFHVLSKHFIELINHIKNLAKGHFSKCFCSDSKDEFGPVGRSFDKMGDSLELIVSELQKLGYQLMDSIAQITQSSKEQEAILTEQQLNVKKIERTAQEIAVCSHGLINAMNDLVESSSEKDFSEDAKKGLDHMENKMSELEAASLNITSTLNAIQDKIRAAHQLMNFMNHVSDQAALLSLNCAIETANESQSKYEFNKITSEIQRFAEKNSTSTQTFVNIIKQMSLRVTSVKTEANHCLKEIMEGARQLQLMNTQLTEIMSQGKKQMRKFDSVRDVMELQAFAVESIIKSVSELNQSSQENINYMHLLDQTNYQLNETASELKHVLKLFFSENKGSLTDK